jgi:hypothetical protein
MIDITFSKPIVAFKILGWLAWDYTWYFIAWYACIAPNHSLVWEFLFSLQLIRCQYQAHDCWHGQWTFFVPRSINGIVDFWFMATMGLSKRWWIDTEHGPHHKHVNDHPDDPDDFASMLRAQYIPLILLTFPAMCLRGMVHSIQCGGWRDLAGTMTFNWLLYQTMDLHTICRVSAFYVFTFALTQWFRKNVMKIRTYKLPFGNVCGKLDARFVKIDSFAVHHIYPTRNNAISHPTHHTNDVSTMIEYVCRICNARPATTPSVSVSMGGVMISRASNLYYVNIQYK